ncbi:MAG TPA: type I DNA topoisomerase [candidate division Zixibacteria bacterium]|nr:type I DNA topoisomerase [candidate division Zixibacteria bacterium]
MPPKKRAAGDVVIVESPAKAKTIERYLGPGYTVLASYGHVRDLPKRSLGVDVDNDFAPRYEPLKERRRELEKLASQARAADTVWLATDLDREGESIAWHIAQYARLPEERIRRVTFSEITRTAIEEAFANPRGINQDLVDAQQARRVIDRLVGYKLSPLVSSKIRRGLSAGRVQSVAVRLVVDREREIQAFTPEEYWTIDAQLRRRGNQAGFTAQLTRIDGEKARIGSEDEANEHLAALREAAYTVTRVTRSQQRKHAPPPFTTSTLQQEASRKLGFGAKRTMSVAQTLYEGVALPEGQVGLITYMRTDSVAMARGAVAEARDVIRGRYGPDFVPDRPNVFRTRSRGAQEAHEAIRPSSFARTPELVSAHLKPDELKLYELIWRRALASQMEPARFDQVGVDIAAGRYTLHAGARKRVFDGYQALYVEGRDDEEDERLTVLPDLAEGEGLDMVDLTSEQHFTQPPPRYTEATLIRALEEHGIGRPSTYAPTLDTIRQRGYVTVKDRRLYPEESAFRVTDLLKEHFPEIVDLQFTARMEDGLDDVARGEQAWVPMVRDFWVPFSAKVTEGREKIAKQVEVTDIRCPVSGEKGDVLVKRFGRNGWFYGCSGYPECRYTRPVEGEEPREQPDLPGVGERCPQCGQGTLTAKQGRFGPFVGCDRYPRCRYIKKDAQPAAERFGTCPKCGQGTVVTKRARRGRRPFWGCDRYPDCDYATWTRPAPVGDGQAPGDGVEDAEPGANGRPPVATGEDGAGRDGTGEDQAEQPVAGAGGTRA